MESKTTSGSWVGLDSPFGVTLTSALCSQPATNMLWAWTGQDQLFLVVQLPRPLSEPQIRSLTRLWPSDYQSEHLRRMQRRRFTFFGASTFVSCCTESM